MSSESAGSEFSCDTGTTTRLATAERLIDELVEAGSISSKPSDLGSIVDEGDLLLSMANVWASEVVPAVKDDLLLPSGTCDIRATYPRAIRHFVETTRGRALCPDEWREMEPTVVEAALRYAEFLEGTGRSLPVGDPSDWVLVYLFIQGDFVNALKECDHRSAVSARLPPHANATTHAVLRSLCERGFNRQYAVWRTIRGWYQFQEDKRDPELRPLFAHRFPVGAIALILGTASLWVLVGLKVALLFASGLGALFLYQAIADFRKMKRVVSRRARQREREFCERNGIPLQPDGSPSCGREQLMRIEERLFLEDPQYGENHDPV